MKMGFEVLLRRLVAGDIVHGVSPNGASLVCLVIAIDGASIIVRRLLVPELMRFDVTTGKEELSDKPSRIQSIAPLPNDVYATLITLDRRHRLDYRSENARLTDVEKRALLYIADYYEANPIEMAQ